MEFMSQSFSVYTGISKILLWKDIFFIFPRGENFKIMAGRNILASFKVDGYMERVGVGP